MSGRGQDETAEETDANAATQLPDDTADNPDDGDKAVDSTKSYPASPADSDAEAEADADADADADSDADTVEAESRPDELESVAADGETVSAPPAGAAPRDADAERDAAQLPVVAKTNYTIIEEHDRGGLGRIMRARDKRTGRIVAIKEILEGRSAAAERFAREALITANLQHPAIVPVYEVGQWESNEPFYAMKLVSGESLAAAMKKRKTTNARLGMLSHIIAVADAMAYAHSEGVIHRDMKPSNVLVGSFGETVVIDWGLAKRLTDGDSVDGSEEKESAPDTESTDSNLTRAGSVMGTPAYMSPEQGSGENVDERTDVYAIGAMLYHLLTGKRPFSDSKSVDELLAELVAGPPKPITDYVDDVPADLVAIANKAMAHNREDRYRTAGELADELRKFQNGKLVAAHSYTTWQLVQRWLLRHKIPVAIAGVALLVVAVVGTISIKRVLDARDHADAQTKIAKQATQQAVTRLASLYAEQGRQALRAERHDEAAAYLSKAYSLNVDTPGLRTMLARAMSTLDRRASTVHIKTAGGLGGIRFARKGTRLLTNTGKGLVVWDSNTGAKVATLEGAPKGVNGFTVSPDGSMVAAIDTANTLRVWSTKDWKPMWAIRGTESKPNKHPVFSDDSSLVAIATFGRGVDIFEARTGAAKGWLLEPKAMSVAFSVDDTRVLVGSLDATAQLHVWDRKSQERVKTIDAGVVAVLTIKPVANNQVLTITGEKFQHWDITSGKKLAELEAPGGSYSDISLSPSKTSAVVWAGDGTAIIWDTKDATRSATYAGRHKGAVISAGMSGDGLYVYTRGREGIVAIRDRMTGAVTTTVAAPLGQKLGAAMDQHRHRIATVNSRHHVAIVDYSYRPRFVRGTSYHSRISGLDVSADGTRAVATGMTPSNALFTIGKKPHVLRKDAKEPVYARLAKRGERIALAGADGKLFTYNTANGKQMATWQISNKYLAISDDGRWVASEANDGRVAVWSTDKGELSWSKKPFKSTAYSFVFSPDGKVLAATSVLGEAAVFNVATGAPTLLKKHEQRAIALSFSRDSSRVAVVSDDRVARISDASSGRELYTLTGKVVTVGFSDKHIAGGNLDGSVSLFDVKTGKRVSSWKAGNTGLVLTEFDQSGGRLLTSPLNGPVRIWDTRTNGQVAELPGHQGPGIRAKFLGAGDRVIAQGTSDSFHRIWDVSIEKRSAEAIDKRIKCLGLYRLDGDKMVSNEPDKTKCTK